jgi:F-type H+-transporting ATPase subunit a
MAEKTLLDPVKDWVESAVVPKGETLSSVFGDPLLQADRAHTDHMFMSVVVVGLIVVLALVARSAYKGSDREAMIPEGGWSVRNAFEAIFDATLDSMADMMGRENAKRYFPVIGALVVFILLSNLVGLIPGFTPPTQNLNTNAAMAISVFFFYNTVGFVKHGASYMKEFFGPILLIAPLMFVIEIIGHLARPLSLAVRLAGNMGGDHAVLGAFNTVGSQLFNAATTFELPFLVPVPFFFLGLVVSVIQTMVFALLSAVYISMALEVEH